MFDSMILENGKVDFFYILLDPISFSYRKHLLRFLKHVYSFMLNIITDTRSYFYLRNL